MRADIFYNFQNFEQDQYGDRTIKEFVRYLYVARFDSAWEYTAKIH